MFAVSPVEDDIVLKWWANAYAQVYQNIWFSISAKSSVYKKQIKNFYLSAVLGLLGKLLLSSCTLVHLEQMSQAKLSTHSPWY